MQWVADMSRWPKDNSECIRRSQNDCKKSHLPAKSLKMRPEKPEKPGNQADALSGCIHTQSDQINARTTAKMPEVECISQNEQKSLTHQSVGGQQEEV